MALPVTTLGDVQLRDGRFVMLPVDRITATRNSVSGLLRQRALWLVACLHLLADEQRHELGGSAARISQARLATFTGLSPKSLTRITRALLHEPALEITRPIGPTGPEPTIYRLLGDPSGPRVFVTHPALRAMREHVPSGVLAGAFATYLTIAELANEQRVDTVTISRQAIARLVGVSSTRSIDEYVGALQAARLLCKHAVCTATGQQPVTWELVEPGDRRAHASGQPLEPQHTNGSAPRNLDPDPDPAQTGPGPGAAQNATPCTLDRNPMQDGPKLGAAETLTPCNLDHSPGAECPGPACAPAAPITRAADNGQDPRDQDTLDPPTVLTDATPGRGEAICADVEELCEHLAASLARRATPAILRRPGGWAVAADTWRPAATTVLADIDLARAKRAVDYLEGDTVLGSQIRTMRVLAERLDEILLRVAAVDHRTRATGRPGDPVTPAWAQAQAAIQAAIRRHGTNRTAAAAELGAEHPAYELFIDAVGWMSLCRDDPQRRQWDWQQAWKQACTSSSTETTEEAA